jgi:radical SAM superfamily enzyme YgiQ (UPF0313 family)
MLGMISRRSVVLLQLPIPPQGPAPIRGNVPLAAACLQLFARQRGLEGLYHFDIVPPAEVNTLGDRALVEALLARDPWLVGVTCYVWNIERTLWIARELKRRRPQLRIVLGGPEITADNSWVLNTKDYDFAVIGEGEQTLSQLLLGLLDDEVPPVPIAGLYVPSASQPRFDPLRRPAFRTPLEDLNRLGSPYLAGILDAADEQMLLLETTRGCVFKCKFCYYPKSYDRQYYLSRELILAGLRHARERGAREVFLLDPTLNQRKDFADFLRVLAEGNPGRQMTYFGELRAEGVTEPTAALLREAGFAEVEVGLQSIEPEAMRMMDRRNNLRAFERGVRAMMKEGIRVKVDMIVGLPGDTAASVRAGLHYLRDTGLYSDVQVFNLSILPGTAFRDEAAALGLQFQPRSPYYLLSTPTLARTELFELMREAQDIFEIEFDAQPPPDLEVANHAGLIRGWTVDLDADDGSPPAGPWAQAFTLWLRSRNPDEHRARAADCISRVLRGDPFTTLQVVLEPLTEVTDVEETITMRLLDLLLKTCQANPTYLDRYYALQPGRPNGAKRLIVVLPLALRPQLSRIFLEEVSACASIVWHSANGTRCLEEDLPGHECAWVC